jgi:hypothetical protein
VCVRVGWIKSNDSTKYVELPVEYSWTRVRFPPLPPAIQKVTERWPFLLLVEAAGVVPVDKSGRGAKAGFRGACAVPPERISLASEIPGDSRQSTNIFF